MHCSVNPFNLCYSGCYFRVLTVGLMLNLYTSIIQWLALATYIESNFKECEVVQVFTTEVIKLKIFF